LDFHHTVRQNLKTPETITQRIDPDLAVESGLMRMMGKMLPELDEILPAV